MTGSEQGEGDGAIRRACDQCRLRKIRCDKDSPCANCRIAKRTCSSTGLGQKPKEGRQRVLISTQYERKIDHFEARLTNIENMLRDLSMSIAGRSPAVSASSSAVSGPPSAPAPGPAPIAGSHPAGSPPPSGPAPADMVYAPDVSINASAITPDPDDPDEDTAPAFEGDSSMAAQTAFASEFLEHTVTRTLLSAAPASSGPHPPHHGQHGNQQQNMNLDLDPDMQSALSALQQMAGLMRSQSRALHRPDGAERETRFSHAKPLPPPAQSTGTGGKKASGGGLRALPMPPAHVVVALLRELKEVPLTSFAGICIFVATENFAERCRRVYFATDDYSLMTWGVVNAGLYFLLQEKASLAGDAGQQAQLLEYQALCRDNLETALANLPLLLPARRESIEVLVLGTFYAIEASKFTAARDLSSIAAMLCQTLGYHRIREPAPEDESKVILFWSVYLLDKALSVRSGRAPVIQDYDVTAPRRLSPARSDLADTAWSVVLHQWISYADFLGRAYEQLYSPAALARPREQRVESAKQLIQDMLDLAKEQEPLLRHTREKMRGVKFDANSPFPMDMSILGDELMHWSALTLVYRAIPSPPGSASTFNAECIHAARQAFARHFEYMAMAGDSLAVRVGCIRWNIIYVPFTPVIILFCHVVETSDEGDLRRLAEFADSLLPACGLSEAVARLHRVCQVLHNVASLCVHVRARVQQRQQQRQQQQEQQQQHQQRQQQEQQRHVPPLQPMKEHTPELRSPELDMNMAIVGDNIDMCLSQLGFMPQFGGGAGAGPGIVHGHGSGAGDIVGSGVPGAATAAAPFGSAGGGNEMAAAAGFGTGGGADELGNWFSGNTHILGLLEEDLSEFDARMWP
ncbi:hypothetical protein VTJ83DRAFT_1468 [Remersonia thermophila]|uniref:Zn(2)-C6 fungal-type domain-containing protein n=1 Tax=Remersonia thermophila TaxID=72144 RepID=A0ABR4DGW2_9PEZI